jgi:hypothetical protein
MTSLERSEHAGLGPIRFLIVVKLSDRSEDGLGEPSD